MIFVLRRMADIYKSQQNNNKSEEIYEEIRQLKKQHKESSSLKSAPSSDYMQKGKYSDPQSKRLYF